MEGYVEVAAIDFDYKMVTFEVEERVHETRFDQVILEEETGKRDKHGNMIFVGDIVKDEDGVLYKVYYNQENLAYMFEDGPSSFMVGYMETLEIVGTIHDKKGLCDFDEI